jgi:hypothetical protein
VFKVVFNCKFHFDQLLMTTRNFENSFDNKTSFAYVFGKTFLIIAMFVMLQ